MHSFLDSKAMAKALRRSLTERNIDITHSDCLELVARQFGLDNWNMLAARIRMTDSAREDLPGAPGWFVSGNTDRAKFRLGLDLSAPGCALIESRFERASMSEADAGLIACLMQSILATAHRGQRLQLTAGIRTEQADLATLWMRIDEQPGMILHFDNMMERQTEGPVTGTSGWCERRIVLDVPVSAQSIHYGFFLKGHGRAWARAFRLETVDDSIASTERATPARPRSYLPAPVNLDFWQDRQRRA